MDNELNKKKTCKYWLLGFGLVVVALLIVNSLLPISIIDTIKGIMGELKRLDFVNEEYLIAGADKYHFDMHVKDSVLQCYSFLKSSRRVSDVQNFNRCMYTLAADEKRWEICLIIQDNVCLGHYAYRNDDKNTCELFNRDWEPEGEIGDKYYDLNLKRCKIYYSRDENICEQLDDYPFYPVFFQTFKEECYLAIGVIKKDFSVCDKAGRAKDKCYNRIKSNETYLMY